jgi:folate-binding protein YgfZ
MATGEAIVAHNSAGSMPAGAELDPAIYRDVAADLSHFGLIAVVGPEAQKFLASLFTGDVRQVSPAQGQFTSWCDGKGRILTTFWLFMRSEAYYLLLPKELLPSTLARFRQFLLRSKATISDASGELVRLGLCGQGLMPWLADVVGGRPATARGETRTFGDCTLVALGGDRHPRWILVGPATAADAIRKKLQPGFMPVDASAWSLLDILAGIPLVMPETSGEFIPQMLNLEALGGLCFTKGCYPGQEVVARLQYRGQLKRRMYLAYIDGEEVPRPGSKLYGPGTSESVGMVLSAARAGEVKVALLAVIIIDQKAQGEIRLGDLQGPRLDFLESAEAAVSA